MTKASIRGATLALVLALAACGGGGRDAGAPTPRCTRLTPSAGQGPNTGATLGVSDSGKTFCVRRGATLTALLRSPDPATPWSTPVTSNATVLQPVANGQLALPLGLSGATFRARSRGGATISAFRPPCTRTTVATCDHTHGWRVQLLVG